MDPNQNNNNKVLLPLIEQTTNNVQRVQRKRRNKILKNPKLWIGLVFLLVLVVTIISLILYSNVYIDEDEKILTNLSPNSRCNYTGFVSVTNSCHWDSWIKNETLFQERITSVYSMSPFLKYFFIDAKVNYNLTDESKPAEIRLNFKRPSTSVKYPLSVELVEGILKQDVYDLEMSACQDSHMEDSLQVIVMMK